MAQQYVDGFLLAVPRDKLDRYREVAGLAGKVWKELGALEYRECLEDQIDLPDFASLRAAAGADEHEAVIFAWITYPSKAERDRINAAVMQDPRLKDMMPFEGFDCKRMAWGGFSTLVLVN